MKTKDEATSGKETDQTQPSWYQEPIQLVTLDGTKGKSQMFKRMIQSLPSALLFLDGLPSLPHIVSADDGLGTIELLQPPLPDFSLSLPLLNTSGSDVLFDLGGSRIMLPRGEGRTLHLHLERTLSLKLYTFECGLPGRLLSATLLTFQLPTFLGLFRNLLWLDSHRATLLEWNGRRLSLIDLNDRLRLMTPAGRTK
jgi:hypothetical protein